MDIQANAVSLKRNIDANSGYRDGFHYNIHKFARSLRQESGKFKQGELLRGAYAMLCHSVALRILLKAYQSLCLIYVATTLLCIKRHIMAKVQIASAITLDGYLPDRIDPRLSWIENNRNGFPLWRDSSDCILANNISFLSLISEKRDSKTDRTYLAELLCTQQLPLIKGLFAYGLVDEVILYILPVIAEKGVQTSLTSLSATEWTLKHTRIFPGGIYRFVYKKVN